MRIQDIDIDLIDISPRHRQADPDWVETLRDDIGARGQQVPIQIAVTGERFLLIKGRRRLLAARTLGMTCLKAVVLPEFSSEAALMLAQISAQVLRGKLVVLDRAVAVAHWRMIYEETTGEVKPGPKAGRGHRSTGDGTAIGGKLTLIASTQKLGLKLDPNSDEVFEALAASFAGTFSEAAQRALGLSKSAVSRCLRIASISESVRERIALHPIADHQSELLALSAESPERQAAIADLLLSSVAVANVADAIALIDHIPPVEKQAAWERVSDKFSKLPDPAKRRFLMEHWSLVEEILAERKAA